MDSSLSITSLPLREFIGNWISKSGSTLNISLNGIVNYMKNTPNRPTQELVESACFYATGFRMGKELFNDLQGVYRYKYGNESMFIVDGEVFKRSTFNIGETLYFCNIAMSMTPVTF